MHTFTLFKENNHNKNFRINRKYKVLYNHSQSFIKSKKSQDLGKVIKIRKNMLLQYVTIFITTQVIFPFTKRKYS